MKVLALSIIALAVVSSPVYAEVIELENGDRIEAEITGEDEDALTVQHPLFGEAVVPRSALKQPEPEHPGMFGTDFLLGWERLLGVGISGSKGNTKNASFNLGTTLDRTAETFRGAFESALFYATADGDENTKKAFAGYLHDFLFKDSRFSLFATGRFDYDKFQVWKKRFSGSSGVGYGIIERDTLNLRGRLGAGVDNTWGSEDNFTPEGVAGLSLEWRLRENQTFEAGTAFFSDLEDTSKYRLLSKAAYRVSLGNSGGLSLRFGARSEFNKGQVGKDHDLTYYGNLVYAY
jgi:putative salt-induced outer membrane protein YdiY